MAMASAAPCTSPEVGEATEAPPAPDDDEVVHEVDVFISHGLGKLLLAQYPLRPTYKGYTNSTRDSIKVKPVNRELEMELQLQSTPNQPHKVQKLSVHQRPLVKPNSAIGFLKSRQLHLCPLDSIIQMTPSFEHIDKKVAEEAKLNAKVEKTDGAVQSVTRRVMRVETEREKSARLSSYSNIQTERQKESWIPCDYRSLEHPYTQGCRRAIMKGGLPALETMTADQYMRLLLPRPGDGTGGGAEQRLPPAAQVEQLLRSAHVLSFREIQEALPALNEEVLVTELTKCAHLVQGNWVLSSKSLYPAGSKSDLTGVPADLMVHHRNFVLCCFAKSAVVERLYLEKISRIPSCEVEYILKQVSVLHPGKGWYFKRDYCASDQAVVQQKQLSEIYEGLYTALHLKNHRDNPLVAQFHSSSGSLPPLSMDAAAQLVERLGLSDIVDTPHVVEMAKTVKELVGRSACLRSVLGEVVVQCVPPEHCSPFLDGLLGVLNMATLPVVHNGQQVEVVARFGPGCEPYKRTLFDLFAVKPLLTRADIQERVQGTLSQSLTRRDYQNISAHLCRLENKLYSLRVRESQ